MSLDAELLQEKLRLRENISEKIEMLDEKLITAENYILDQEDKFKNELDNLTHQLEESMTDNADLRRKQKQMVEDNDEAKC